MTARVVYSPVQRTWGPCGAALPATAPAPGWLAQLVRHLTGKAAEREAG